ncbi:MAG TPA: alginate lyase family protein [Burkholderiales bacterium]|nr:alginate lyase family protein [Burkholderiales bacterium]
MDALEPRNLAPDVPPRLKRKLRWTLNRLRCMSAAEVAHRAARALQARAERAGLLGAWEVPPASVEAAPAKWLHPSRRIEPGPYVAAAERIAEGWLELFALREVDVGSPPRWNRDPKTGIEAPLGFGKLIDYRDPDLVGDIKYLWEPNRHGHLVTLAQAFRLTGESRYARAVVEQLDSWLIACPYGVGPNWTSALEVAMRLVSWSAAWQLLGEELERQREFKERWLRSVYQHAHFVRGWFSRYSSANNHLIGEATGLFLAALAWPHWGCSREWLATAKGILEREALIQNAPDGVNREQAVWYQLAVLDMLVLCLLAGKANGQWFSPDFESRIEAMMDFIASVTDAGGNLPMFGDADDGLALRLSPGCQPVRALLGTGALLFHRGDFKLKVRSLDDSARWLFGEAADERFDALDAEKTRLPLRQAYPEGGYYVLGCEFETPNEVRVVADAGALGYRSIAAHGHADALSFTLSAFGREFLVDPGTYAYHTQERWRQYFRGTAAHNTVRIDGEDQSVQGGNFLWLAKARAGCSLWLSSPLKDSFEGWHDGYLRLEDPVKHRRFIELDKRTRRVLVEDRLEMAEEHEVELAFHCSERCRVDPVQGGYLLEQDGFMVRLVLPVLGGSESTVYCGSLSPIRGWISRALDRREPAPTIVWRARLGAPALLRTEIAVLPPAGLV